MFASGIFHNQMKIINYLLFCLCLLAPCAAHAELVAIDAEQRHETITLTIANTSPHKVFLLGDPNRLVVDVPSLGGRKDAKLPKSYQGKLIKAVRLGQFNAATSRFVFDLNQSITVEKIHDDEPGKFIIDIAATGAPIEEAKPKKAAVKKPSKPVIVIDAGHGGQDPGTSGPGGSDEKDITLDYAKALRDRLMKSGRYQVVLTRDDDEYITLRGRVDIARKAQASLFISLHADSAPDAVRGLSVYTVSEKASDAEAEALAARENKSDVLSGMDLSEERKDVADILISLAERETKNRSATLADVLVTSLDGKVHLLSNSHRFAGFAVLKAPDIPSVLVEIGFLSHPKEEKLIRSKTYRDKVTAGIAAGVDRYFRVEKRLGEQ